MDGREGDGGGVRWPVGAFFFALFQECPRAREAKTAPVHAHPRAEVNSAHAGPRLLGAESHGQARTRTRARPLHTARMPPLLSCSSYLAGVHLAPCQGRVPSGHHLVKRGQLRHAQQVARLLDGQGGRGVGRGGRGRARGRRWGGGVAPCGERARRCRAEARGGRARGGGRARPEGRHRHRGRRHGASGWRGGDEARVKESERASLASLAL